MLVSNAQVGNITVNVDNQSVFKDNIPVIDNAISISSLSQLIHNAFSMLKAESEQPRQIEVSFKFSITPDPRLVNITPTKKSAETPTQPPESELAMFERFANQGDVEKMKDLASCYLNGRGVEKDMAKGAAWLQKAVDLGDEDARSRLGVIEAKGLIPINPKNWTVEGSNEGAVLRQKGLELQSKKKDQLASRLSYGYFNAAAEKNDLIAIYTLGQILDQSDINQRAFELYLKGAEQGEIECQYEVAIYYYKGYAGVQDNAKAFEWMSKVAERDDHYGNYFMGVFYSNGIGIPKDALKAIEFYLKPLKNGPLDENKLDCCRGLGPLLLQHPDKFPHEFRKLLKTGKEYSDINDHALAFFCYVGEAITKGNAEVYNALGRFFLNGLGVDKDINQAFKYFEMAADLGDTKAMEEIAKIYHCGKGQIKQDLPLALAWYLRIHEYHPETFEVARFLSNKDIAKAEEHLKKWPKQPIFKKEDLIPWNHWEIDTKGPKWSDVDEPQFIIDKSTGRRYLNESKGWIRFKCFWITLGTPLIHGFMSIVNIIYRVFKTLLGGEFWFWRVGFSYNFKARIINVGIDLLRIVLTPIALLGLQLASLYGVFNPLDGRKLYTMIERCYYGEDGFRLAPCFEPDPTRHALGGDINKKDQI